MTHVLKDAVLSFYSGHFYGEMAKLRKGIGMRFVVLLTAVTCCFYLIMLFASGGYSGIRDALLKLPQMADSLPAIDFKNGKLSIDKPSPYKIQLGTEPDVAWIIIDTDYKVADVNALQKYMEANKAILLVTADQMVTRDVRKSTDGDTQIGNQLRISSLKDNQPFLVTHENWKAFAAMVNQWGMVMLVALFSILMFFCLLFINFAATFFSAVAVMLVNLIARTNLDFSAAMRLAAAARIPVNILSLVPIFLWYHGMSGISEFILWAIYMIFAVCAVRFYSAHAQA